MFKWRTKKIEIKMRRSLEPPPDANGLVDKNKHFSVRGATQTDAREKCDAGDALGKENERVLLHFTQD
jgi:hypothetical protein